MIRLFGTVRDWLSLTERQSSYIFSLCLSVGSLFAWKDSQRQWEQMLSGVVSAGYSGYWTWKTGPGNKGLRSSSVSRPTSVSSSICIRECWYLVGRRCDIFSSHLYLTTTYDLFRCKLRWRYATIFSIILTREIFAMIIVISLSCQQTTSAFCSSIFLSVTPPLS